MQLRCLLERIRRLSGSEPRRIELAEQRRKLFSLPYQQTISCLYAWAGMSPAQLVQTVLTLPLGNATERLANHYEFFSIFEGTQEYTVRFGAQELGTITAVYPEGYRFALAGRSWEVVQVDKEDQIVYVEKASGVNNS